MTFKELKEWFDKTKLPKTLDSRHRYYLKVEETADLYIFNIELEMSGNEKPTANALVLKNQLHELYNDLQVKENWNRPKPEIDQFTNKNIV